VQQKDSKENN